jgi:hypothetical protein
VPEKEPVNPAEKPPEPAANVEEKPEEKKEVV